MVLFSFEYLKTVSVKASCILNLFSLYMRVRNVGIYNVFLTCFRVYNQSKKFLAAVCSADDFCLLTAQYNDVPTGNLPS